MKRVGGKKKLWPGRQMVRGGRTGMAGKKAKEGAESGKSRHYAPNSKQKGGRKMGLLSLSPTKEKKTKEKGRAWLKVAGGKGRVRTHGDQPSHIGDTGTILRTQSEGGKAEKT